MDKFVNDAYDVTSQLFGSDSGIPSWAWLLVGVAVFWKVLLPERQTAQDRDDALVAAMTEGADGKKGKKKK
jgi:hypothetical protein